MIDLLPLVNKTVPLRFRGADLSLDLSHALFSSFGIDAGTKLLFKAIGRDEKLARAKRILDAGSGVGVIGLGVAAAFPDARIVARDRDLLAVAFSERNRRRNRI
jgi:16S rRNA G1207 methylase RsmC